MPLPRCNFAAFMADGTLSTQDPSKLLGELMFPDRKDRPEESSSRRACKFVCDAL